MKSHLYVPLMPLLSSVAFFSLASCERQTPAEEAADDISDAIEDAGDDIGDAVDDATN